MKEQKSFYATPTNTQKKWVVIDASDKILGRLASYVAGLVRGKYSPTFTPSANTSDFIVIINADKIKVTGKKMTDKVYYWHTGYPGGIKSIQLKDQMKKDSTEVIQMAIKGMLPHNRLGRHLLKQVKIYAGASHPHEAQSPIMLEIPAKEM
jgi:large subunit ribosomal protein L13